MLVVEDDELIRKLIMHYFEDGPYEFLEAPDGQDALRQALTFKPDVIITDLMMPRLDGAAFIKILRQLREFSTVPIIAVTAGTTDTQSMARQAGANLVLSKPLKGPEVIRAVEEFLSLTPFVRSISPAK